MAGDGLVTRKQYSLIDLAEHVIKHTSLLPVIPASLDGHQQSHFLSVTDADDSG